MFSTNHFIWILICVTIIVFSFLTIKKYQPSLKTILTICCVLSVLSEVTKVLSVVKLVPSLNDGKLYPYLELNHLPFHLCSLQILFIFYQRFSTRTNKLSHYLFSFMYPSCILGAIAALAMPSIFNTTITVEQAFTHPMAYQFFLYHTMLIVLGIAIVHSKEVSIEPKDFFVSILIAITLGFVSIYLNSIFSTAYYENGVLVALEHTTNFFFVSQPPINISFTKVSDWYCYVVILIVLTILLISLLYLPIFKKKKASSL